MEIKENSEEKSSKILKSFKKTMRVNEEVKELTFDNLLECFSKKKKSLESVNFIKKYFKLNMTNFVSSMSVSKVDENEILTFISLQLRLEMYQTNKVLMRIGDKGEKYYIILKGEVDILVPKEIRVEMTYQEFINYIISLKKHFEFELLFKCLLLNKMTYSVPEDIILNTSFDNYKKFKKSNSIRRFSLNKSLEQSEYLYELLNYHKESSPSLTINYKEYIDNLTPKIGFDDYAERRSTIVFQFTHVVTLKTGEGYGDLALTNADHKRTATIITSSETYLGALDRSSYDHCLKDIKEKERKNLIGYISTTPLFSSMNKEVILKEFINFFVEKKVRKNDMVISDGEDAKYLYLIKEGEYGVSLRKSINEIDMLINNFCGQKEENRRITFTMMKSEAFKQYVSVKRKSKVSILLEKDIIGFQNMICDGKYCLDVTCLSDTGILIQLDSSILPLMYNTDKKILNNIEHFMNLKLPIINKRLNEIKLTKLDFFCDQEESKKLSNPYINKITHNNYISIELNKKRCKLFKIQIS